MPDISNVSPPFIVGFIIILISVYTVTGIIYVSSEELPESYEQFLSPKSETLTDLGGVGDIIHYSGKMVDTINIFFDLITFNIPKMPNVVRIVLNCVFIPMIIIFIINVYPYIRDLVEVFIKILDTIVPF